jgi:hypothetical protein
MYEASKEKSFVIEGDPNEYCRQMPLKYVGFNLNFDNRNIHKF